MDDNLAVNDLQSVELHAEANLRIANHEEFGAEGLIDGPFDVYLCPQQFLNVALQDVTASFHELLVDNARCFMEDVAEDAVVDFVLIVDVWLAKVLHVDIVEAQRASLIAVDGGRSEKRVLRVGIGFDGESLLQRVHHLWCLFYGWRVEGMVSLRCLERFETDVVRALYHELEQESAHLASLTVSRCVVVGDGHIVSTLQKPVEVIAVDSHLMVHGGQSVSLSYAIWDERRVVDASWHVALVA